MLVDYSKVLDSIHRGKMEQILPAYGVPQRNCNRYNNDLRRYVGHDSLVAKILQNNLFTPFLFIICQKYLLLTSINLIKVNSFTPRKATSRQHPRETITDADNADDLVLLRNFPVQAKWDYH